MGYGITYLILILLIVASCLFPKSKFIKILIAFAIYSMFAFSIDKGDYYIYERLYNAIGAGYDVNYEATFILLSKIGNWLNLDYYHFRLIFSAIELIILDIFISRYTEYPTTLWGAYLLFSSMFDAITIRHFMATLPMLFVLTELNHPGNKKSIIKYYSAVIIAGLTHSSFWFFLVLYPLKKINNRYKIIISLILVAIFYVTANTGIIFRLYSLLPIREYTIEKYNHATIANINGLLEDCFMQLMYMMPAIVLWYLGKKYAIRDNQCNIYGETFDDMINSMISLNLLFCFIIPFQIFVKNFSRMQRILVLFNYVYMSRYAAFRPQNKILIRSMILVYAGVILLLSMLMSSSNIEYVWDVHFGTNPVFQFLFW